MKKLTKNLMNVLAVLGLIVGIAATVYFYAVMVGFTLWNSIVATAITDGIVLLVYQVSTEEDLSLYED